jgi:hypothetical protein
MEIETAQVSMVTQRDSHARSSDRVRLQRSGLARAVRVLPAPSSLRAGAGLRRSRLLKSAGAPRPRCAVPHHRCDGRGAGGSSAVEERLMQRAKRPCSITVLQQSSWQSSISDRTGAAQRAGVALMQRASVQHHRVYRGAVTSDKRAAQCREVAAAGCYCCCCCNTAEHWLATAGNHSHLLAACSVSGSPPSSRIIVHW